MVSFSIDLNLMDFIGQDTQWTVGRKLMQVNDSLTSEDAGPRSSKNCTEPGKMTAALGVVVDSANTIVFVVIFSAMNKKHTRALQGKAHRKHCTV